MEANPHHLEPVRSNRQVRQRVESCFIGHNGTDESLVGVRYGYFRARQHGAGPVPHLAADLPRGNGLTQNHCACQSINQHSH